MNRLGWAALLLGGVALGACGEGDPGELGSAQTEIGKNKRYEVWLVDQSNTNGTTFGGTLYIWQGKDLEKKVPNLATPEVFDLGGATSALCMAQTGANPVRPHMLFANAEGTQMWLAFVASGHVVQFDTKTRTPLTCMRASVGAAGARQAHAATPAPDGSYVLIANQNGKLLERLDGDGSGNYVLNPAATINLATCTTPNGAPCELAGLRNDNAPICPNIESTSQRAFITLRGGGLLVVDAKATPMQIVGEYDIANIKPNGCAGLQKGDKMYISSGGGTANNLSSMDMYSVPVDGYSPLNPPNTPARSIVFATDDTVEDRDGHGAILTKNQKYLWFNDRTSGVIEVIKTSNNDHTGTISLAGGLTADPAPDLSRLSPNGKYAYLSMRGPVPLSGDPHASVGDVPGLGIVRVKKDGKEGYLKALLPISNIDAGGVQRADAHGIEIVLKDGWDDDDDDDD